MFTNITEKKSYAIYLKFFLSEDELDFYFSLNLYSKYCSVRMSEVKKFLL
uniref:Uncharacterized protein n=1 Tax=viral metagenome TaxID=1070528 RepID=A0A6C0AD02_9ZZZZ